MAVGQQNSGQNRPGQQGGAQDRPDGPEDWGAIKEDVSQLADVALDRGRHFLDSAREQATGYVDRRKDDAAQSVNDLAQSLRDVCKQFDDRPNIRAFVDSAADGLEQLAGTIRTRSFGDIYGDVEEVMRRRPTTVAAAGLVAGFLFARFLKSSAEGVRQAEMERSRNAAGRSRQASQRQGSQRPRAQASAGSPYAQQGQV